MSLTSQLNVCEKYGNHNGNAERPSWSAFAINFGDELWDELLMGHDAQNPGRDVNRLGSNGQDADDHARVQDVWYAWSIGVPNGNDEGRRCHTATAQESFVIARYKQCDKYDAEHVDKVRSKGNELRGVSHRVAWILCLTTHDADEDLIANSPGSK